MSIKQQHTHKSGGIRNSQPEVNFSNLPLLGFSLIQVGVIRQGGHPDFNGELLSFFPTPPFCGEYCWGALTGQRGVIQVHTSKSEPLPSQELSGPAFVSSFVS